jgi:hypothetical protein
MIYALEDMMLYYILLNGVLDPPPCLVTRAYDVT